MNLNDFFSKPSHVKEAYTNNYPSSIPAADATAAVSSGKAIDDPDIMGSLRGASEPKFDRFAKTVSEPAPGFQAGDEEDPEFMVEPNKYVQSWAPKSSIAPNGWRYVEKDEDPARYGSNTISGTGTPDWRSIAANASPSSKSASASGLPKMRFDIASQRLVPVDQPIALDLSPKNNNIKSGSNSNIDADTRARALAWAARKNAPGGIRAQDVGPDNSAPAAAKPTAVTPPAASLKDLPVEKPSSWKDIAQANGIDNPNRIMPGQTLKIPGRADYVVKPGDTLAGIAAGKTKAPKSAPSPEQDPAYVAALAKLKKNPNIGVDFPVPPDIQKAMGMGPITTKTYDPFGKEIIKKVGSEELVPADPRRKTYPNTPAGAQASLRDIEKANNERIAARDAAANRKKVKEDDIDEQTVPADIKYSGMNRTMGSAIATHSAQEKNGKSTNSFNTTSMFHDPANPNDNSYMDRSSTTTDGKEENSTRYATNVTPAWMKNLKSTAGITTEPAAQPPSQYPTQVGQGMNNKPFAAYSTPPGQLEINRESLDRMRSLAGIRKK